MNTKEIKMKTCPNCGDKHNNPRSNYCCQIKTKACPVCDKPFEYKCYKRLTKTCSRKCSANVRSNKCLRCGRPAKEKYCGLDTEIVCKTCGVKKIVKCKGTLPIYCSMICSMQDPEIKEKIKQSQFDKYGSYGFNTEKQRETMLKKYGHITPAKNEKVKAKIKKTQFANNDGLFAFNTKKQNKTMMNKKINTASFKKQLYKGQNIKYSHKVSKVNLKIANIIENEFNVDKILLENRVSKFIYDIFIPEFNLLIDINPTISHNVDKTYLCTLNNCSDECNHKKHSRLYHQERALIAMKKQYFYVQKFDWMSDKDLIDVIYSIIDNDTAREIETNIELSLNVINRLILYLFSKYNYEIKEPEYIRCNLRGDVCDKGYRVYDAGSIAFYK